MEMMASLYPKTSLNMEETLNFANIHVEMKEGLIIVNLQIIRPCFIPQVQWTDFQLSEDPTSVPSISKEVLGLPHWHLEDYLDLLHQ